MVKPNKIKRAFSRHTAEKPFLSCNLVEKRYNEGKDAAERRADGLSGLGGCFLPLPRGGEVIHMTYSELFQFCLLVVSIISLVYQITKKK